MKKEVTLNLYRFIQTLKHSVTYFPLSINQQHNLPATVTYQDTA